ncbi:hypothetical protein DPMN_090221 [Dreissena polymorpha]|uniref:HTH psq-type domain-containing protein n=1 Tax=Dreissena polymorpha TaxID=45954 RepID=A0A9D4KZR9_DREPO|nr:hypothetical protein DPMN_090221 [Dreissena polymorpha]
MSLRSGEVQVSVSRDLNIAESTLRGWLKDEAKLRSSQRTWTVNSLSGKASKPLRIPSWKR